MEFLAEHFEIVDPHVPFHSRIYRLISAPSKADLQRLANYDFLVSERIELLDRYIAKEEGSSRAMARTVKLCQLWMDEDYTSYIAERDRLKQEFPSDVEGLHVYQANQLDDLVERRELCRFF